jgi:CNP1-like family
MMPASTQQTETGWRAFVACIALLLASSVVWPQSADLDPDWKESNVPPPPAFDRDKLVAIEMPAFLTLKYGVDPATIKLSEDGVVRYVVVASSSSGALNAFYEGIRCTTAEFKTYARYNPSGQWNPVSSPQWRSVWDTQSSKHTRVLAFQGVCKGKAVSGRSPSEIIRQLQTDRGLLP